MRILVCGGRNFSNRALLWKALDRAHARWNITAVIHGAAPGADTLAGEWGKEHGVPVTPFPAPWHDLEHPDAIIRTRRDGTKYNAKAGPIRNQQMLDEGKPDIVIAFPGRIGTPDMMKRAREAGVTVYQVGW